MKENLIKVFVYGSLKQGYGNNYLLSNSTFLKETHTQENNFKMISFGNFPGILENGNSFICGELYEIDEEALYNLDILESNGNFYTRKQIFLEDEEEPVWVYFLTEYFGSARELYSTDTRRIQTKIIDEKKFENWV